MRPQRSEDQDAFANASRSGALLLILLFLAGCASPRDVEEPLDPVRVEGPILIDAAAPGGEPMLALAPDGTLYLQAVSSPPDGASVSAAWRSEDRGRTWIALPIPDGAAADSFDGAIAAGPAGEVYLANAENAMLRIWRSDDGGESWSELDVPRVAPAHRMWLAPSVDRLDVGIDTLGGPNFHFALGDAAPTLVARNYEVGGALARRASDGLLLWPRHEAAPLDRFVAYQSADDGATWTSAPMTASEPPETFPVGEARRTSIWTPTVFDANGTAYHARSASGAVLLSRSLDGGATWSPEFALTRPDDVALMPWLTPRLDVVAIVQNGTAWSPLALRVVWPAEGEPTILRASLPGIVHEGPLCTFGQACDPNERPLGDYPAVVTLDDGDVVAAFGSSVEATAYRSAPIVYRIPAAAFK